MSDPINADLAEQNRGIGQVNLTVEEPKVEQAAAVSGAGKGTGSGPTKGQHKQRRPMGKPPKASGGTYGQG